MWKRRLIVPALLLLAAAGAVVVLVGQRGESDLESWIGEQLRASVQASGKFALAFDTIDYQGPNRIVVTDLRFSRNDVELNAPLVTVARASIDLAEIPRKGKPLAVQAVALETPVLNIGSFIAAARHDRSTTRSTTRRAFSSVITLRSVEVTDGTITYDDGKGAPLSWNQLSAGLVLEPSDPRSHRATMTLNQPPLIKATLAAEIDLDALVFRNIDVKAILDLSDASARRVLTPPLQQVLKRVDARGRLDLQLTGMVNARARSDTQLDARFELTGGHVSIGAYNLPVDRLVAAFKMRDGTMTIEDATAQMLGGSVKAEMTLQPGAEGRLDAQLIASRLQLEEILDASVRDEKTSLRGRVDADIRVRSDRDVLRKVASGNSDGSDWGSGYVKVSDGRLVRLPVLSEVIAATLGASELFTGGRADQDSFEAQFRLVDKLVDIGDMVYRSDAAGMRGKGRIGFDGEIDLVVNAGPLERIQQLLGPIGTLWGDLSDRVMSYSVKGSLKKPDVKPMLGRG